MKLTLEREKEIREKVERQRASSEMIDYLWKNEYDLLAEIDALREEIKNPRFIIESGATQDFKEL